MKARFPSVKSFLTIRLLGKYFFKFALWRKLCYFIPKAYSDLNAIKNALVISSWNCLKKAWYDVESVSQEISTLILSPERNLEAVTEGLQRWKEHTRPLSWNLTVYSLLLHTDSRSWCPAGKRFNFWSFNSRNFIKSEREKRGRCTVVANSRSGRKAWSPHCCLKISKKSNVASMISHLRRKDLITTQDLVSNSLTARLSGFVAL